MKRIIITGSSGFIGRNLMSALSDNIIRGIDEDYLFKNGWQHVLVEILSEFNPDVVFHVGACSDTLEKDVICMFLRNYEATKIIVDWCEKNRVPLVYSSSAANYGTCGQYPTNLYGWSKYTAEDYVLRAGCVALRYFNVYGPGEAHKGKMASVAYQSYLKHSTNRDVCLFPKNPQRDFIYVKDVVAANICAWKKYTKVSGKYFDVGTAEPKTFEEVLANMNIPYKYLSADHIPQGYQFYTCSDPNKWLPTWKPQYSLREGLHDYLKYLKGSRQSDILTFPKENKWE